MMFLCVLILLKEKLYFVYKVALFFVGNYVFADLTKTNGLADYCNLDYQNAFLALALADQRT